MSDAASVLLDGPWEHEYVAANGARFHVALAGDGPLVLLLHDFPQFWWAWRHQLVALADAGYRAAAVDLRGFGASDKPPRGYDTYTATADAAAVIRSLGEERAVVVGAGLGGWTAWAMPNLQPAFTRGIGAVSMAHPAIMQRAARRDRAQRSALSFVGHLQWPFRPERSLIRDDTLVRRYLTSWAAPGGTFPSEEEISRYAAALALPFVAHSAAEYYRWFGRNQVRRDGPLFQRRVGSPIQVPVLQVQGSADGCVLADATGGSQRYVSGPYTYQAIEGAGHFLPEEAPTQVSRALIDWLATVPA
ncbi:MAG TPA: alpha/beta hydrolase [Dermatophilaceae bacterium]|nr:alpha/beta hydrolase [Dermatophilaceae bacterium]HOV01087.1 alpha/beta hydrolase [Dermatophilaceae bacterium]HPK89135.1 alpha/beta hydrolase [Dermatophilaceae bacterium]HPV78166.1 alpha/beta hydrolase [Dermatophilaceae bacterium]